MTKECMASGVLPVVCTPRDGTLGFPSETRGGRPRSINVPESQAWASGLHSVTCAGLVLSLVPS